MKTQLIILIILITNISFGQSISKNLLDSSDCSMTYLTTIENFNVWLHNSSGAIIYRAKFAVDADGCPRAYGPNNTGLDWTANAGYPGNWWGIVTDVNGDPVVQGVSDPYPGMYVSTTSLVCSGYSNTNPLRYVDSENVPYIALPSALQSLGNISKGDFAYVRNTTNGNSCFAYFADSGPAEKLGEGSINLAYQLGLNSSPRTGGTSLGIIDYVVFPQSGFGQGTCLTATEIDSIGQIKLFEAGGTYLPDCIDNHPLLDCSNSNHLTFDVNYHGSSSANPSFVGTYGCNSWTETGPERIHSITPTANGTITATLSNYTGDLDVYILGSCDPSDCLGTVYSEMAVFNNAIAGHTYYFVVDADDGSGSSYDLLVTFTQTVNIETFNISNDIRIFPNPTKNILQLNSKNRKIEKVQIINTLGIVVDTFDSQTETINLKNHSKGFYFIKVTTDDNQTQIFKIVKD